MFDNKEINGTQLFTEDGWKTCKAGLKLNSENLKTKISISMNVNMYIETYLTEEERRATIKLFGIINNEIQNDKNSNNCGCIHIQI